MEAQLAAQQLPGEPGLVLVAQPHDGDDDFTRLAEKENDHFQELLKSWIFDVYKNRRHD